MSSFLPEGYGNATDQIVKPAVADISDGDRKLIQKLFSRPELIPEKFLAYIVDYLAINQPLIPLSQIIGYQQTLNAAKVKTTAAKSISGSAHTLISWDAEIFDVPDGSIWDISAPTQLVTRIAGRYSLGAQIVWDPNVTGIRDVAFKVNGAFTVTDRRPALGGGAATINVISDLQDLAVGDAITLDVFQDSGGALNVQSGSSFYMARVA